jgi:hypothetical protein
MLERWQGSSYDTLEASVATIARLGSFDDWLEAQSVLRAFHAVTAIKAKDRPLIGRERLTLEESRAALTAPRTARLLNLLGPGEPWGEKAGPTPRDDGEP